MTARHTSAVLIQRDEIVASPAKRACDDRTFELPPALHVLTGLFFVGFVSVLSLAFRTNMTVNYAVFLIFILAFFSLPALWVRMKPEENHSRALGLGDLLTRGIRTPTGRLTGGEAMILVLLLPFTVFCWSIAVAIIAASVR